MKNRRMADITVANLLAVFARPNDMLTFQNMSLPDALVADFERWRERPVMRWVIAQYETHRDETHRAVGGRSFFAADSWLTEAALERGLLASNVSRLDL